MTAPRRRFHLLSSLVVVPLLSSAFVCIPPHPRYAFFPSVSHAKKTLDDETVWRLRFFLNRIPTELGKRVDETFTLDVNFIEDSGYEPPQGIVKQIVNVLPAQENSVGPSLKIEKSRWQLSEDPNDRKDGLWIWGLFSEPLYPFLLLNIETSRVPLLADDGDFIKPLQLFAQITHSRDTKEGVVLSSAELKVRDILTVKADPFGAATVDLYEEVLVGKLNIQAL
ncbi:hypothetical protein MHU86_1294 [Fragilaria crotonensis]|nr:hypothetical protein MHU86_1294 [Fragilaria crotonensis]